MRPYFILTSLFIITNLSCSKNDQRVPLGFEIHPSFNLDLVASEPLIFDPVDIDFDEDGNTFILEMPGYPLRDEDSRIVQIIDNNNDGVYDERIVFAEDLGVASSMMPYRKGILVAAPPYLLWVGDNNNDGIAELRDTIMDGFSAGNLQHNFNGLSFGLDNWIYAANGGNSGAPYFVDKSHEKVELLGQDFRFKIEDQILQRVGESSGGHELAFDDWGHMFETHNLEHVSHLALEEWYHSQYNTEPSNGLVNISDHEENGLSRIYPIGEQETRVNHPEQSGYFSGSCGISFYGGEAFPKEFNDQLFVADVVLNLVHIDLLSQNGSIFKTSRHEQKKEFLASSDRSFRPIKMSTGPDGAFYLVDMYRDVIEHPEWIPDEIEETLDLFAGREKGRIYKISPNSGLAKMVLPDFTKNEGLVQGLSHQNQWIRLTAQRLVIEQPLPERIDAIEKLVSNTDNELALLHGLWILSETGRMTPEHLLHAWESSEPYLRENVLKMIETLGSPNDLVYTILRDGIMDPHPRVRMRACLAASTLDDSFFEKHQDELVNQSITSINELSTDSWNALSISLVLARALPPVLDQVINGSDQLSPAQLAVAKNLISITTENGNGETSSQILNTLANVDLIPDQKAILLEHLKSPSRRHVQNGSVTSEIEESLVQLESSNREEIILVTARLRKSMGLNESSKLGDMLLQAETNALDPSIATEKRLESLRLLALQPFNLRKNTLFQLIHHSQPLVLQEEVMNQLMNSIDRTIGKDIISLWSTLGPKARKLASNILLYKVFLHDDLLTALENDQINIGEMNFDLERRRALLWSSDNDIKRRAEALFSDAGVVSRKAAMDQMRPALALEGDRIKGEDVFNTLCAQCHVYGDHGKDVGPVLTEISRKSKESLLHDIIDPNAAVDPKYINHQITDNEGKIYVGVIDQENDRQIVLKMLGGIERQINKENISELRSLNISMMPEGQESNIKVQEMADLLAYLQSGT